MKRIKLIGVLLLLTSVVLLASTGEPEKGGFLSKILGLGGTGIAGIGVWFASKFKGLRSKIKEILDIPLVATKKSSKVAIETAQAIGKLEAFISTIRAYSDNPDMKVSELFKKVESDIEQLKKEFKDIPESINELTEGIRKEINDVVSKKK